MNFERGRYRGDDGASTLDYNPSIQPGDDLRQPLGLTLGRSVQRLAL
jgi:hypothetical protein